MKNIIHTFIFTVFMFAYCNAYGYGGSPVTMLPGDSAFETNLISDRPMTVATSDTTDAPANQGQNPTTNNFSLQPKITNSWGTVTQNYQTKQINEVKENYTKSQNKSNTPTTSTPTTTESTTENTSKTQSDNSAPVTPDPEKVQQAKDAEQAYQDAREVEKAGRPLTALATGMTGAGGYMIASSISEKIADKNAEKAMNEYIGNMYCNYGGGQQVDLGDTEIIPDGDELFNYYQEYVNTANRLKSTKAALNLTPGIESQVVYTDAKYNLYNYQPAGARSTGEISLARALMDKDSADATAWAEQKEKTNTMLGLGTTLAVGGIGTGLANRAYTNKYREQHQRLKEDTQKKEQEFTKQNANWVIKHDTTITPEDSTIKTMLDKSSELVSREHPGYTLPSNQEAFSKTLSSISLKYNSTDKQILFSNNSANLTPAGQGILDDLADNWLSEILRHYTNATIQIDITGHTDKTGTDTRNNTLSQERADSVKTYLSNKLSNYNDRIQYKTAGKGSQNCPNSGVQDACRRIELTITDITNWENIPDDTAQSA